jgi:hypothetical protein
MLHTFGSHACFPRSCLKDTYWHHQEQEGESPATDLVQNPVVQQQVGANQGMCVNQPRSDSFGVVEQDLPQGHFPVD